MLLSRFFACGMLENKGFVIITSGVCLDFMKNIVKEEIQEDVFQNIDSDVFYWYDDAYDEIGQKALRETLENLMGELTLREQEVLKAKYGFEDGVEKTLEEVGQTFGVTRERIRQIESKASARFRSLFYTIPYTKTTLDLHHFYTISLKKYAKL